MSSDAGSPVLPARPMRIALLVDRLGNEYTDTILAELSAEAREKQAASPVAR